MTKGRRRWGRRAAAADGRVSRDTKGRRRDVCQGTRAPCVFRCGGGDGELCGLNGAREVPWKFACRGLALGRISERFGSDHSQVLPSFFFFSSLPAIPCYNDPARRVSGLPV